MPQHTGQLPGSKVGVYIAVAFAAHFRPDNLELLCRTRHDGYHEDVLRIQTVLFGKVGLGYGALHLVRALAAGEVGDEVLMEMFAVLDPAGAAGGDHGEHAAVLNALQELGALFHDGQIRGKVHIEYPVRAQTAQGRGQLAGGAGADGHAEFLANGHTHGGGGLEYHKFAGIAQSGPNSGGGILLG
ncbi:hypothetical protein SDC9_110389 [bioreactor metagenome]|uniref:Uncharacterized protein n=1 Tax=bioreactor metagenome TaxID=1076179 RepID=A0A645BDE6_9ZZZZ